MSWRSIQRVRHHCVHQRFGRQVHGGGEEQPLATINVTDRGFTVKIDVTNDQAKKVKTGDTAELVNFWGGDAVATLDQITSSQTAGNRTSSSPSPAISRPDRT
ncbi:MAG: hypothetical protein ACLU3I_04650 [Acutalibacteraceae bacterium]